MNIGPNAAGRQQARKRHATDAARVRSTARSPASPLAVRELIEPTVCGLGYELVDVERAAGWLLRVTVDTLAPAGRIGVDDCERVSRQLSHLLTVEQVAYERLEVSSPGLDRPLTAPRDFVRFSGSAIHVQLRAPLDGRRRFRGRLLGLSGQAGAEQVRLALSAPDSASAGAGRGRKTNRPSVIEPQQTLELPLADIEKARLVPQFDFRPDERPRTGNRQTGAGVGGGPQQGRSKAPKGKVEGRQ
jgi:ribosome maturation factor RimP